MLLIALGIVLVVESLGVSIASIFSIAIALLIIAFFATLGWTQYSATFRANRARATSAKVLFGVIAAGIFVILIMVLWDTQKSFRLGLSHPTWRSYTFLVVLLVALLSAILLARLNYEWEQALLSHNLPPPRAQFSLREMLALTAAAAFVCATVVWMLPS